MQGLVLVMVPDEAARTELCRALANCKLATVECPDFSHALAALGRARFNAVVCTEGKPLTTNGFLLLARKRHPHAPLRVLMNRDRSHGQGPESANVGETFLDGQMSAVHVARHIQAAIQKPPETPFDVPNTTVIWETLERAAQERSEPPQQKTTVSAGNVMVSMAESPIQRTPVPVNAPAAVWSSPPAMRVTAPMTAPPPKPASGARVALSGPVVFSGDVEDVGGAALLMTLLVQRLTGVLHVETGSASGLFCFYGGDPVWAEDGQGDESLFLNLCTSGALPPGSRRPDALPGGLLGALVASRQLTAGALERALAHLVRERLLLLCNATQGGFRFHEHQDFMQQVPLLRLNPFGVAVEAARQQHATRLPQLVQDLERLHVIQTPSLAPALDRIQPLVGNADVAGPLAVPVSVTDLWKHLPLAPTGAALVTRALLNAGLIKTCNPASAVVESSLQLGPGPEVPPGFLVLPDTTVDALPTSEDVHESARQNVLALYLRIKPLAAPHLVLGVSVGAGLPEARAAHAALMAQAAEDQVPNGPHKALLMSHLAELRAKADAALEAMALAAAAAQERTGSARLGDRVVTLQESFVTGCAEHTDLQGAPGNVLVDAHRLKHTDGPSTLVLGSLCQRPSSWIYVAGLPLRVLQDVDRNVLALLRGRLLTVVARATCPTCAEHGCVSVDATFLPETVNRPPRPCQVCGAPARVRISAGQRAALEQWLTHPVPAAVQALLGNAPQVDSTPAASPPPRLPPLITPSPVTPAAVTPDIPSTVPMGAARAQRPAPVPTAATPASRFIERGVLGRGGMGEVLLAQQQGPQGFMRTVALKRVLGGLAHDPEVRAMFMQEARTSARITHANVVHIYELGEENGCPYLAMEFVRGWDLRAIMDGLVNAGLKLPVNVACRVMADVCAGLHAAHTVKDERGRLLNVVHRDVSAQNVMVGVDGGSKVTDFGIARAMDSSTLTRPGTRKGKPSFMSPEQVDGSLGNVDARSDVWAAGVLMHEMLTGVPLFRSPNMESTLAAVLTGPIPSVLARRPDVPLALDSVVMRALQRPMANRHPSAQAMGRALEEVLFSLGRPTTHQDVAAWLAELLGRGILKQPPDPGFPQG